VKHLKVVYSREEAKVPRLPDLDRNGRRVPASISYVPAAAGLVMAEAVIAALTDKGA
jgi:tRNA A37 threonylcarbamoyladenosine dehydratase